MTFRSATICGIAGAALGLSLVVLPVLDLPIVRQVLYGHSLIGILINAMPHALYLAFFIALLSQKRTVETMTATSGRVSANDNNTERRYSMAICPKCEKEIAEGAVVCKHCGSALGTPTRPKGVTVIAVLAIIGAGLALLSIPSLRPETSVILGISVSVGVARLVALVFVAVAIYCGIGLLKLRKRARQIYLWVAVYGIANSVISTPVLASRLAGTIPYSARSMFYVTLAIGVAVGLALYGYILYYIVRRKDYFVN